MQDVSNQEQRIKRGLEDSLSDLMAGFGYLPLETPILEPTELFLRKSGGELAARLYSFTDPGGASVSLRPEFTSSIVRYYLENASEIDLPARWQYSGPGLSSRPMPTPKPAASSPRLAQNWSELPASSPTWKFSRSLASSSPIWA